jgi:hypothetical protein
MSTTWRVLVLISLVVNGLLIVAVLALATRDTPSAADLKRVEHKTALAQDTANQALQFGVDSQNADQQFQPVADQLVDLISEQTHQHAQLQGLCDWAESVPPGSQQAKQLRGFKAAVCDVGIGNSASGG